MRTIIVIFTDKKVSFNEAATLTDLAIIAKFFNGSWKKTINNAGYFISNCSRRNNVVCTYNGVDIYISISVYNMQELYTSRIKKM